MTYSKMRRLGRSIACSLSLLAFVGCSAANTETLPLSGATDGGHDDGASSHDGSRASDAAADGPVCTDPRITNDPACPASYSSGNQGKPCAPIGLMCGYAGAGDGTPDGCFSTAAMWCRGDAGSGAAAGSTGASTGTWTVAQ
jgi:hypothetical protein